MASIVKRSRYGHRSKRDTHLLRMRLQEGEGGLRQCSLRGSVLVKGPGAECRSAAGVPRSPCSAS